MDGIRSRGVLVSIASFIFSSFGLALSVVGSLLDLSFGHDAVAHLLAMAAGQQKLSQPKPSHAVDSHHLHPSDAAAARHRARTRSPSPSRKHHQHHEHHRQLPHPASILLRTSSSTSSPDHDNRIASDRPQRPLFDRTATCPSTTTTRARSPIPIIAIHEPDAHDTVSSDSAVTSAQSKVPKKSSKSKIASKRDPSKYTASAHSEPPSDHPTSDTLEGNHQPHQASQQPPASSSRPPLPRSRSAYASDSETRLGRAPSLRERKPSITFLQPVRPPKDANQDTETGDSSDGGERRAKSPKIPKLGTSPSQFKSQHRKRLSRCSSSPNLSTPPATPTDFAGSSNSSRSTSTSTTSFVIVTPEPVSAEEATQGQDKGKGDKGGSSRPTTPSRKMTLGGILRKIPSAPGPLAPELETPPCEKSKKAFAFNFSYNTTPKKEKGLKTRRSQPSFSTSRSPSPPPLPVPKPPRTQPYDAPYFFPMPDSVQPKPARRKARDSAEGKKSSSTKPSLNSRASSPDLNHASRTVTDSPSTH